MNLSTLLKYHIAKIDYVFHCKPIINFENVYSD